MKKVLSLLTVLILSIFLYNCSKDEIQEPKVDFSTMSKSKIKDIINQEVVNARTKEIDTPGGPQDCRISNLQVLSVLENLGVSDISSTMDILYDIRDNKLDKGETGRAYIDAYYYLSSVLENEDTTLSELSELISVVPTVINIQSKLNDASYTGVIINDTQKNELIQLINLYSAKLPNDVNYQNIINVIVNDLNNISNRNSTQIENFISQ